MSPGHPPGESLSLLKPLCLRVFVVKNRFYCRIWVYVFTIPLTDDGSACVAMKLTVKR